MSGRPLAFRYLYKSGVIKENTVTVFGELGKVFEKGTDYDEEVDLTVPYMDLSNLIMYYTGTVADGTVGSTEEGSLRNLNAPISNVPHFRRFSNADNATGANHYYVGDIVLFDPITGSGNSTQASCWTCIRTTSDLTSPIPELANEIAAASAADGSYNTNFNGVAGRSGPGMTGIDNRGQRFIVGVMPALYSAETGVTVSPYWRESALAKSYFTEGNYYQGEIVVFNANVYRCKSTNGLMADPPLYQRERYTVAQELDPDTIPGLDLALAPSGAFGFDSSGTRYLMGVPPAGGLFSGLFWEPATLPKTPSGSYLNINWDNTSITDKIQFYDANVVGGAGGQAIPTFTDDLGNTSSTLRKIYDDNEKNFVLTVANQILSTIPAAAIKSQAINARVDPDNTLLELVNLGPTNSKPTQYTPAVQGLFEESLARDMLRISGYANTITEIVVTDGSSGYRSVPSVQITGGLATNPKLVPYAARALARLGVKSIKINKSDPTWNFTTSGVRFAIGDVVTLSPTTAPTVACTAKVYRVDSAGNILSILITDRGSGYSDVASVTVRGVTRTFLEPVLEVVSVDLQSNDTGFYAGMKVAVEYGSGGGAVGYAVVETVNGVVRLSGVNFDGPTQTDPTSNEVFNISRGANYVSGNFKKDVVALQGYVYDAATAAFIPLPTARAIGFVTKTQGNAIAEIDVINNGSGYTSKPQVLIDRPIADVRDNGSLSTTLESHLATIISSGIYPSAPPVSAITQVPEIQEKVYLGLTNVDVKLGGSGFSQGEVMSVSGGGIVPAKFNVTHDSGTDTYSALVMEGGDGYSVDTVRTHMNQIILQNDAVGAPVGDQLRAEILSVGGGIVDIQFNAGRPTGAGFTVGDVISVADPVGGDFRFTVTGVGNEGTIAPSGFTIVDEQSITAGGFSVNQTLVARSKFLSVDTITLNAPQPITQTQPTVVIEPPTGSHVDGLGQSLPVVTATATVSLKVDNISIANAGTGYRLGDIITITQPGAVTCEAIVLALANNDTGSVGVIAIRTTGSLFDISRGGNDAITVNLPTTSGTGLQVGITYAIDRIVVTNPGVGYLVNPVATLDVGGSSATLAVTTKKFGGSTATFRVTAVDAALGMPTITPLSPGSGYLVGDILSLLDSGSGVTSGAFITVNSTQSRGLRTGTMIPGYRGSGHVISENLITGTCTKIGSPGTVFPPILYSVTKVTPPNSISRLRILDYKPASARYANPTSLSHKPHAVVKVASVDALGSILSLVVESKGYGYTSLPTIKPLPQTRGTGASLFAVSLGVSRVEFIGGPLSEVLTSISIYGAGLPPTIPNRPATAIAQLAGDLNTISTDGLKNPNILDTLETLKPGSTSGYAQAKPNMGVSSVTVDDNGRGYNATNDSNGNPVTYVEVTAPDLPNGVRPTFAIQFDSLFGIASINVLTSGSGYSKLPKALIKMSTSGEPSVPASVTLNMKLLDGYVISGGEGYVDPPTVTVSAPDVNPALSQASLVPTMRKNINGFNIVSAGSQYISPPTALVVGPGNGGEATATMGISDIYVVNGGAGYAVGDMLVFPTPSGGKSAIATVVAVTEGTGAIRRVTFTRSMFPIVATELAARKNDFLLNGGSGYLTIPTVSPTAKVPADPGAPFSDLYNPDGSVVDGLVSSTGTGAEFSVRLGVQNLTFTSAGNNYESDATVLIQEPPSSQAANFSAVINGAGQLNAFVKLASGSGYTRPPGVIVQGGNGAGASVTPLMGVAEIAVVQSGAGYRVGDTVTFAGGNPIEPARAVVTVIDDASSGIGADLDLRFTEIMDEASLSVDANGNLVGKVGAVKSPLIVEGGYAFELGDVITINANRIAPSQAALNSIRAATNFLTLVGGKLTRLALGTPGFQGDVFKTGTILKVTPLDPLLTGVAYLRINTVLSNTVYGSPPTSVSYGAGGIITVDLQSFGAQYGNLDYGFYGSITNATQAHPHWPEPPQDWVTVLASNDSWGADKAVYTANDESDTVQKLKFEIVNPDEATYPGSVAHFKITQVISSVGAVLQATPCTADGTIAESSGMFYTPFDRTKYGAQPRGRISFVQVLNPGSGYQSMPTAVVNSATKSVDAQLLATIGVVGLRIDQRGAGYLSNPEIVIEAPHHRSLVAQAYARSGVFDIDVHTYDVIDQGSGYTGNSLTADGEEQEGGVYRLVGGALHQTDGAAQSVDTELIMLPGAFVGGKLSTTSGTVAAATTISIRGSNYRVGDIVSITPVKSTTSGNQATPARIRIKQISKMLDINNGLSNNGANRTGAGILDYGLQQNGEDIGAYGTGYYQPPTVRILGGNQGVTLATSLGVVAVEIMEGSNGSNYQVGDLIQMISPEFSTPVDIGVVSLVDSDRGLFQAATLYEPFSKGLKELPTLSIKRRDPSFRTPFNTSLNYQTVDAVLRPVLGVTVAGTTTSIDGFIGRPYVYVSGPTGIGYVQQPKPARITPNLVTEVARVDVFYTSTPPEYVTSVPRITIAEPPSIELFSGWRSVRFNKNDSFEVVVQYTIAKAISFQVDPDASLPSSYFTATSITIGGVNIPLRQAGGKGMQGRELSANRIIRRYKIKFIAV